MTENMKIRARMIDGAAHVVVLVMHPMETGQRKDPKTGQVVPAHFIQKVSATLNERHVFSVQCGPAVAKNPIFGFRVKGARPGDRIAVSWRDNRGEQGRTEATIA